jgi:hypothetical protein
VVAKKSDLLGRYSNHVARNTRAVVRSAIGGVLLIDEAYALLQGEVRAAAAAAAAAGAGAGARGLGGGGRGGGRPGAPAGGRGLGVGVEVGVGP